MDTDFLSHGVCHKHNWRGYTENIVCPYCMQEWMEEGRKVADKPKDPVLVHQTTLDNLGQLKFKAYIDSEIDRLEKEIRRLRFDLGALSGHLVLIHDRLDTLWLDAGKEDVG